MQTHIGKIIQYNQVDFLPEYSDGWTYSSQ